jgi:hypothetical protein
MQSYLARILTVCGITTTIAKPVTKNPVLCFYLSRRVSTPVILSLVLIGLGGCALQQRREAIAEEHVIIHNCDLAMANPEFAPLRGKVPLSNSEGNAVPTLAEVTDPRKPTKEDKQLLLDLDKAKAPCRAKILAFADKHLPLQEVALLREAQSSNLILEAKLYNGDISYGQFWRQRYDLLVRTQKTLADYDQAIRSQRLADQQAASATLLNTMRAMQTTNQRYYQSAPANPIITTNCRQISNSVQCISQ